MLIDTDVLIWYLRGNERAFDIIEAQNGFYISVITYIELLQGMRNKDEQRRLRAAIRAWGATILFINEEVSIKAMFFIGRHHLIHSLQLADALICATAIVNGLTLLTGNDKHYKMIKEVDLQRFRP